MASQPLAGWYAWHLFYHSGLDRAVARFVRPVVQSLLRESSIDSFFFVRYGVGGPHVRLRLAVRPGCEDSVAARVASIAAEFLQAFPSTCTLPEEEARKRHEIFLADEPWSEDRLFPDNCLQAFPFIPETSRYGGTELLVHSLDYFALSSAYALDFVEIYRHQDSGKKLSAALHPFASQALGFARDGESFLDALGYSVAMWGATSPSLVERGDKAFEQRGEGYRRFLRREMEEAMNLRSSPPGTEPSLMEAARRLNRALEGIEPAVRQGILGSQMHMTANRLGLGNPEEVYLGRLLWRTAQEIAESDPSFWNDFSCALEERVSAVPRSRHEDLWLQTAADLAGLQGDEPAGTGEGLSQQNLSFIAREFKLVCRRFEDFLEQLPESGLDGLADHRVNGPLWMLGHLAFMMDTFVLRYASKRLRISDRNQRLFGFQSRKEDGSGYPPLEEVRDLYEDTKAATLEVLEKTEESKMLGSIESEHFENLAESALHCLQDVAYHTGQLLYLMRLRGERSRS